MTYPKDELIAYRMNRAREALEEAKVMSGINHWQTCINRLYYACFYAVNALLLKNDLSSAKHTGVRALFNNRFVSVGIVHKDHGRLYQLLSKYRQQSDYEDFFQIDEDIVKQWLQDVKGFIDAIHEIIYGADG